MTTAVYIIGTNAVGKTSLMRAIIDHYGGIKGFSNKVTSCGDRRVKLAGKYTEDGKYGGVDSLNETKCLAEMAEREFGKGAELMFFEGSYMNTFGMNLTNAIFKADSQLVVFCYAPIKVIHKRLYARSGAAGLKDFNNVVKKQQSAFRSAKKWASIGVPVLSIDTSVRSIDEEMKLILGKLEHNEGIKCI